MVSGFEKRKPQILYFFFGGVAGFGCGLGCGLAGVAGLAHFEDGNRIRSPPPAWNPPASTDKALVGLVTGKLTDARAKRTIAPTPTNLVK
jgi:hypothetical protein